MSEFSRPTSIEVIIPTQTGWLEEAAKAIGKEGVDPLVAFAPPPEVRDEAKPLRLDEKQEAKLREVAARFGIGAEYSIPSRADVDLLEGGKVWKVEAEAVMSTGRQVFMGSPNRIIGPDEVEHITARYRENATGWTEYQMVVFVATKQDGFTKEEPKETGFGYDIFNRFKLLTQETGQLVRIGRCWGVPVHALRVDRENYVDDEGKEKYRNQPDGAALLSFMSDALTAGGDDSSSVGLNTSNTYPSRALDILGVGLEKGRDFRVGMYGRSTLGRIAQGRVSEATPINQIPGELHMIAQKLGKLDEAITDR